MFIMVHQASNSPGSQNTALQPLYVWPRGEGAQLVLDRWQLAHGAPTKDLGEAFADLDRLEWHAVEPQAMIQWQWFRAGLGPHPYIGKNSSDYLWMEERVWWYRTTVELPTNWAADAERIDLVFDGIDHDATVWVDGVRVDEHFGAFGGPAIDVSGFLRGPGATHEIVVAITPAGTGRGKQAGESGRLVKAETYSRWINNPDLMTTGIWRPVRLVATAGYRLERPEIATRIQTDGSASIEVELEVVRSDVSPDLAFVTRYGQFPPLDDPRFVDREAEPAILRLTLRDDDGEIVAEGSQRVDLRRGRQWVRHALDIRAPRLWWPSGLGDPALYALTIALEQSGAVRDRLSMSVGVREFELTRSSAPRTAEHWLDWSPRINGVETSLRGMNWMPLDLLHLSVDKYRHFLRLAQESGVQIVRVWGGGLIETDEFYEICDELGLMVWQDFPLNTDYHCEGLPLDVWEQQVVWSIQRLRTHPSLVVWCGGNEFDPYLPSNAAAVGIMERSVADLDRHRPFVRSCSDAGDVHPYLDFDTPWYLALYRHAPALTEWGGHSLPAFESLREFLPESEAALAPAALDSSDPSHFEHSHPTLRHHWAEFNPSRIPRMLDRARIFDDLSSASTERFVEAVQLGAAEIYETVAADFRASDVDSTMVMPWVFSRPWPSVGMQVIDHSGRLTIAHSAIRRSYAPLALAVRCPYEALAAGERVPLTIGVNRDADEDILARGDLQVRIYDEKLVLHCTVDRPLAVSAFPSFEFEVPASAAYLFVVADFMDASVSRARATRVLRVSAELDDPAVRSAYRDAPVPTAMHHAQSLRPLIERTTTQLRLDRVEPFGPSPTGATRSGSATVTNVGSLPAVLVRWVWGDPDWILDAEDDYFWLEPRESRRVGLTLTPTHHASSFVSAPTTASEPDPSALRVSAWNAGATP
ncbi:hypothetical protein LTA6_000148 [Microbacterium sp. LTA6]|uniref:glycoside hydrolase family 2 protein n=1 Tax=unclassified Microbacterium TaxID=2609290 RepID=UPI00313949A3